MFLNLIAFMTLTRIKMVSNMCRCEGFCFTFEGNETIEIFFVYNTMGIFLFHAEKTGNYFFKLLMNE